MLRESAVTGDARFEYRRLVQFADCDARGRVGAPVWLEMVCELTEEWFAQALGITFDELHLRRGYAVPVINTQVEMPNACRPGDQLSFELGLEALGRSSMVLRIVARSGAAVCLRVRHKLVMISLADYRPMEIPELLRAPAARYLLGAAPCAEPQTFELPWNGAAQALRSRHRARFADCDPAGIVFYPRFFALFAAAREQWFVERTRRGTRCGGLDPRRDAAAARAITVEFLRPCRLGEMCEIDVAARAAGDDRLELDILLTVDGQPRLKSTQQLDLDGG